MFDFRHNMRLRDNSMATTTKELRHQDNMIPNRHASHSSKSRNKNHQDWFALATAWLLFFCAVTTRSNAFAFPSSTISSPKSLKTTTWGRVRQATKGSRLGLSLSSVDGGGGDVNFARRVAQAVHPSVALVTPAGVRNMTARGSGFIIDYNNNDDDSDSIYLLTAAHVAIPGYGLTVSFPGHHNNDNKASKKKQAVVVARDVASDLALIRIDNIDDSNLASREALNLFSQDELPLGTLAFANGFPGGITGSQPAMTMGIVCGTTIGFGQDFFFFHQRNNNNTTDYSHANTTFVVTDAAMTGGMSGGPLVDAQGNVLGMNALVRPDMRALGNYAVSYKTCLEFLDAINNKNDGNATPKGYRVVLYNDPMNKRERVSRILQEVANLNETMANTVMMSAHTTGRGIVKEFSMKDRNEADEFCNAMRNQDVLAEVEAIS